MTPVDGPLFDCSVEAAQARLLAIGQRLEIEELATEDAFGRHLAAELNARVNLPGADVSIMDGYAIRAQDVDTSKPRTEFRIVGESAAGHPHLGSIDRGQACRISTGAVLPAGATAVVAQEDTTRTGELLTLDHARCGPVEPGKFIRKTGSDLTCGQPMLAAHTQLGPGELALVSAGGYLKLPVFARPRVALLSSGDELVPPGQTPKPGQLVSTNATMLGHQARQAGGIAIDFGIASDRPEDLLGRLREACSCCDLVVTSGGISVGDHDHVLGCLGELGFALHVRKLRLRPGRPTTFGQVGDTPVIALPGNPASTYVAFELFARPLIMHMQGSQNPYHAPIRVELATPLRAAGNRAHYIRARVDRGRATPLSTQVSGALRSLAGHNALLIQRPQTPAMPAGAMVDALLLPPPVPPTVEWS
ncbi:MAG: gephyrin-like molybdotransferase Glp [Nannocystaceae bacterium]